MANKTNIPDYSKLFGEGYKPAYTYKELSYINDPVFGEQKVPDGFKFLQDKDGNNMLLAEDKFFGSQTPKEQKIEKPSINFDQPDEDNGVSTTSTKKYYGNNVNIAKQFFTDKLQELYKNNGFSDENALKQASMHSNAIVGNFMIESGDPTLTKTDNIGDKNLGPKGSAYGIGQWREDRRTALKNFAAKRGKPMSDFITQLEFAWDEMNGSQKYYKVLENLMNSKTIEEATENFMNTYERPNKNPKINGLASRIGYAKSLG